MHALHLCVCGPSVCCLTLLTWTVDPRLQAEPGEKKNRLGRPWVCHLFLWTWSVWIRSFCLSPARRHTRTYTHTIPSSFPLAFLCSVFHGASYTHRHSASGCPVCHVPWPCVWTSVQKGLWFQGEKKGGGRRWRRRRGWWWWWWWWGSYQFIPASNAPRSCFHNPAS